ncbi:MAG: hypothetical protein CL565_00085 [Alphaproteobacteria bacterium]|nr:hypothetical protein [Alphaproteobacteria bacterium]|tara:strand:+ start:177 stop:506 length:330 start_codon:yes stop_codon:yes gene_type:complete
MKYKTETGLSDKSLNDATVKALFRMLENLDDEDHVYKMNIDNKTADNGLYTVELTAEYDKGMPYFDRLGHLRKHLTDAMKRQRKVKKELRTMPANVVAHMYEDHDSDAA